MSLHVLTTKRKVTEMAKMAIIKALENVLVLKDIVPAKAILISLTATS